MDCPAIRQAMYDIENVEGLIKTYANLFTSDDQDAIGPEDYIFTNFVKGEILTLDYFFWWFNASCFFATCRVISYAALRKQSAEPLVGYQAKRA
ncbi:MAG: hypothetical protein ACI9XK_001657 [Granulosicoccus sp.]|jgi:hypothetical protein